MTAILNRWPDLRGVLFDQPHVVAGASELLRQEGVEARCRVEPGTSSTPFPSVATGTC